MRDRLEESIKALTEIRDKIDSGKYDEESFGLELSSTLKNINDSIEMTSNLLEMAYRI